MFCTRKQSSQWKPIIYEPQSPYELTALFTLLVQVYDSLPDGLFTFLVVVKDAAGNVNGKMVKYSWSVVLPLYVQITEDPRGDALSIQGFPSDLIAFEAINVTGIDYMGAPAPAPAITISPGASHSPPMKEVNVASGLPMEVWYTSNPDTRINFQNSLGLSLLVIVFWCDTLPSIINKFIYVSISSE